MVYKISNTNLLKIVLILTAIVGFTPMIYHSGKILLLMEIVSLMVVIQNSQYITFRSNISLVFNVVIFIILVIFYRVLGISDVNWGPIINDTLFFVPILLMLFTPLLSPKQSEWLIFIMITVVVVVIFDNIRLCLTHPEILLAVNRDKMIDEMEGVGNIGGSAWYNSICFFFMVCFFFFLNCKKKKIKRAMLISSLVSGVFVIAFCLKASVIVYVVLSTVLLVFAKKTKTMSRFMRIGIITMVLAFLFVVLFADVITDFLVNSIGGRLSRRLMVFVDSDSMEASGGVRTLNARGRLWMVSVDTWLSNPVNFLFGIGDHDAEYSVEKTGIGHHSALFDLLAKYGFIGAFFVFNILRLSCKYIMSLFDKEKRLQVLVIFLILILFGFTKGIFRYAIGCSLFLILPLLSNIEKR